MCMCILGHAAEPQNWFDPGVGSGSVFHYIWLKYPFGTVTIYSDILFWTFFLEIQNWASKKKKKRKETKKQNNKKTQHRPLFSDILGRSEKGIQTSIFFRP